MFPLRKRPHERPNRLDHGLKNFGLWLIDDQNRARFVTRLHRCSIFFVRFPCLGYSLLLFLGIIGLRFIGERNVTSAFLLYLPRVLFLLPVAVLFPLALIACRKSAAALSISSLIFLIWGLGWKPGFAPSPDPSQEGETITVLTYNRGQHANQSLQPFKNLTNPDIIILQESAGRAARYAVAEGYEKYQYTKDEAEFTLLSSYPILHSETVSLQNSVGSPPVAARFEIRFDGSPISIYAVHALSPRDTLLHYRRGAFLWGVLGMPGTSFAHKRKENQRYWDRRIIEARELQTAISRDPLPTLVAGDLNAPSGGYIHGAFLENLQDAHMESGSGTGYTFPGTTRNPVSGGGPWMRIDYLFCDDNWSPVWCITEKNRRSQHRAVTAQFRFQKED